MCLIVLAYRVHPDYPFIVAANRDEFYARPTQAAGFWPEQPDWLAGRDEQSGGSWLGITRQGRFAAVTNVRRGGMLNIGKRSRGQLVCDFLGSHQSAVAFSKTVAHDAHQYGAFNLMAWDGKTLLCHHSLSNEVEMLEPGFHGLSNDRLNTPWPKLTRSLNALRACTASDPSPEALLALLRDNVRPADHELPETGIPHTQEQLLSSPFIHSPDYGTRACTIVRVHRNGQVDFHEQSFGPDGHDGKTNAFRFSIVNPGDSSA